MKHTKSTMSIATKNILQSVVVGLLWMLSGLCIQADKLIFSVVSLISLLLAVTLQVSLGFARAVPGDERSEFNHMKAKASAYTAILLGLLLWNVVACLQTLLKIELFKFSRGWILIFIGVVQVIEGIYFHLYEKRI